MNPAAVWPPGVSTDHLMMNKSDPMEFVLYSLNLYQVLYIS